MLDLLYCALAAVEDRLPGWHMFESVERLEYDLHDRDGRVVDVRSSLPRGANVVDRTELHRVVRFVCEREHARQPFTYVERGLVATLGGGPTTPSRMNSNRSDDQPVPDPHSCVIHTNARR